MPPCSAAPHHGNFALHHRNFALHHRNFALHENISALHDRNFTLHHRNLAPHHGHPPRETYAGPWRPRGAAQAPRRARRVPLMALWSSGTLWSSGQLWGPSAPADPMFENTKKHQPNMKRQPYYPKNLGDQPEWHSNFARKPPGHAATLTLSQAEEDNGVADNLIDTHLEPET
jgi:hypothetical protein